MGRFLQTLRRVAATLVMVLLLLYVGGMVSVIAGLDLALLSRVQLVPALLSGSVVMVASLCLLTWLGGRWYCSVLCPLGILQDLAAPLRRSRSVAVGRRGTMTRYAILALCLLAFALGTTLPLLFVDPWSLFGRVTLTFFRPLLIWINNLLALPLNDYGYYGVVARDVRFAAIPVAAVALISMALLLYLIARYGERFWCNSICPVGTVLQFFARRSWLRIQIDETKCTRCGRCAQHCKAGVIDLKSLQVNCGDCISCFNCLPVCHDDAISYAPVRRKRLL